MAFGQPVFVDYKPDPSGVGYHFQKPTGESVYTYGDEADQLARRIDATKPPDMRTAMAPPDELTGGGDLPGAGTASVPDVGKPPIGAVNPSAPQGDVTVGEITTAKPALPPRIEPPSGEVPVTAGVPVAGSGGPPPAQLDPISPYKRVAGVNPAAMAKNAVAVPTAESVTVQGGIQDPAERAAAIANLAKQEEAQRGMMGVQESILKQQQSQAETDALNAALARQQAERQVMEGEAQKTLLRQEFQKRTNIAQHELDQQSSREVDQFRMFRGKPGAQVAGMLFAAIGGFASQFNKTGRNPFMDAIDRTMDNDIAAQRQEIQQGVAKANNDLARIKETYGLDYDDASSVLKLAYIKKTEAEANRRAALIGGQQAQINLAALQPTFLKWKADNDAALQAKLMGTIQVTRQARMMQPSSGGIVRKTLKEQVEERELLARGEKADNARLHGGIPVKAADEHKQGEVTQGLSRALVSTETALADIDQLLARHKERGQMGAIWDAAQNKVSDSKWKTEVNHSAQSIASAEANGLQPDDKRVKHLEEALNTMSSPQVINHLESLREKLANKREAIFSVSSKTAKVGNVGDYDGGGGRE